MTKQNALQQSMNRRQPLLRKNEYSANRGTRAAAEVAGGATAECAAVCCCCPCAIVDFIVLAVYKVPAGLWRKAIRNKRHRLLKKKGLLKRKLTMNDTEILYLRDQKPPVFGAEVETEPDEDVMELENEMWERFHGAGFWRSPSQKLDSID